MTDESGEAMLFKVKRDTKTVKKINAYAARKGIALGSFCCTYDGCRINNDDTPSLMGMDDGDKMEIIEWW